MIAKYLADILQSIGFNVQYKDNEITATANYDDVIPQDKYDLYVINNNTFYINPIAIVTDAGTIQNDNGQLGFIIETEYGLLTTTTKGYFTYFDRAKEKQLIVKFVINGEA